MSRPFGYRKDKMAYKAQYGHLIPLFQQGLSLRKTAKKCGLSVNTIRKIKHMIG